jgi:hypothetical protein
MALSCVFQSLEDSGRTALLMRKQLKGELRKRPKLEVSPIKARVIILGSSQHGNNSHPGGLRRTHSSKGILKGNTLGW